MSGRASLRDWLRWRMGRQGTGYEKLLLLASPLPLPFDCYLLRYREGSEVPGHTDPVTGRRHYRLNIVVRKSRRGGEFVCDDPIYESSRIKFFRPDRTAHCVTLVEQGTRYVLSVGWVLK